MNRAILSPHFQRRLGNFRTRLNAGFHSDGCLTLEKATAGTLIKPEEIAQYMAVLLESEEIRVIDCQFTGKIIIPGQHK